MEQEITGKKDNLKKLTNIFETDFRNFLFHSTLNQNFHKILVKWNMPNDCPLEGSRAILPFNICSTFFKFPLVGFGVILKNLTISI